MADQKQAKYTCDRCGKTGYSSQGAVTRHQKRSKVCKGAHAYTKSEADLSQQVANTLGGTLVVSKEDKLLKKASKNVSPLDRLSLIKSSLDLGEIEGKMDENGVLHISFGAERGFDWDEGWDCVDDIYAEYFVEEFQDGDEEEDCGHSELKYRVRITPGQAAQKILEHFSAVEKVFISDLEKLFKDTYPDLHLVDGIDELKGIRPGWKLIDIDGDEVSSRSLYKDIKLWQTGYPSDALLRKVKILK